MISGLLADWVGIAKTYFIFSIASIFVSVLFSCTHLFVRLREGKEKSDESYKLVATSEEEAQK